jgi:hypothetical protein
MEWASTAEVARTAKTNALVRINFPKKLEDRAAKIVLAVNQRACLTLLINASRRLRREYRGSQWQGKFF